LHKKPSHQKQTAFRRSNEKNMVAGEQKNEVAYFLPSMKAFGYM
jgi:hypothetical protein